jgi:hypothetical protein
MGISKVIVNGVTKIDITPTTAAPADVAQTKIFFGADGEQKTGTSSGGGGGGAEEKQVNFIDYDGTLLHSYTKAEFLALSALPANPTHAGLTSQGWNWTKQQITDQLTAVPDGPVWVGQMYITSDGTTQIDVTFDDPDFLSPYLSIAVNGTVTVDWGDNTAQDTITGTNATLVIFAGHTYASTGSYTIRISVSSGSFAFYSDSNRTSVLCATDKNNGTKNSRMYSGCISAIRMGASASVGFYAFCNCYAMQHVTIPSSVTSFGSTAFVNCRAIKSVTIPSGVTSISTNAFLNCYSLQSVTIPSSVTSIGSSVFSGCRALQNVVIPSSVTIINGSAFSSCYSLQSVTIPSSVTSIGSSMFSGCYALQNVVIPSSVTSIGNNMFSGCYALQNVVIPSSVTSIGSNAFYDCGSIKSVTIPDGVMHIANGTFRYCYTLPSITIPSSILDIGASALSDCNCLEEIHFEPTTPPTVANSNAFSSLPTDCIIYVPTGSLSAYTSATNYPSASTYTYVEE